MAPMDELIAFEVAGPVATVTITRPAKRNAVTAAMVEEVLRRVQQAEADDDVKVVVLAAEGPTFCAGFDIDDPDDFAGGADEPVRARLRSIEAKAAWMRQLLLADKPVVVAVQGPCVGIGTYFVLVADFVVAATDASFGVPEERFGSAGATWAYPFLIREVGIKRANELVMTGRRWSAAEFHDLGLINRAVEPDDLDECVASLCRALATLPRDGIAANRAVKRLALATIGHLDAFAFHAPVHANAERITRGSDEFDFMAAVEADGLRVAMRQREERFGGPWWGW